MELSEHHQLPSTSLSLKELVIHLAPPLEHTDSHNQNIVDMVQRLFCGIATDQPPGLGHIEEVSVACEESNWNKSMVQNIQDVLKLPNNRLVKLQLTMNRLTGSAVQWLTSGLSAQNSNFTNNTLMELNLSSNLIGDGGVQHLVSVLPFFTSLRVLQLHGNEIRDDGAVALAAVLSQQQLQNNHHYLPTTTTTTTRATLTTLKLGYNQIGDVGIVALIQAIRSHPTLANWTIDRNPKIQLEGHQALIDSIPHLGTVQTLSLGPFDEQQQQRRATTWRNLPAAYVRTTTMSTPSATPMTPADIAQLMWKLTDGMEQNHVLEHIHLNIYSRDYTETSTRQLRQILSDECSIALGERAKLIPCRLSHRDSTQLHRELAALSPSSRSDYLGMFEYLQVISFFCNLNRRKLRSILFLPSSPQHEHHHHHHSTQQQQQQQQEQPSHIGLPLWPLILVRLQHVPSLFFYMLREQPTLTLFHNNSDSSTITESKKQARQGMVVMEPHPKRLFVMPPPKG